MSADVLPDGRGFHGNHVGGSQHPRWNTQRMINKDGYVLIRVGRQHPLADPNGYAREHILILAAAGIYLGPDEVVHHRNGDRQDNRFENLRVLTIREHNIIHNSERSRGNDGRFVGRKAAGAFLDRVEHREFPA